MRTLLLLLALTVTASGASTVPNTSVEMIVAGGEAQVRDASVVATCYDGGARKSIVCFRRSDGTQPLGAGALDAPPEQVNAKNGHASGTPATDGRRVYADPWNHGLRAVEFQGRQGWHCQLGTFSAYPGTAGSLLSSRGFRTGT